MARTSVAIDASIDDAWTSLQLLSTWEGVAGIEDLHQPDHDHAGDLTAFRFVMDTALGRVAGRANVRSARPGMTIRAEQKGLEITIQVVLRGDGGRNRADVEARSRATSFLNKPLELTLNALLDSSIRAEASTIAGRLATSPG